MMRTAEHLEQVKRWLDENVVSYPTPRTITLSGFEVDWEQMSGRFYVSLDGQHIQDPFKISLAQNGWVQFHPPMFTSPLGAPASYGAVDLTEQTKAAIQTALKSIIPRVRPMGVDKDTGISIGQGTPIAARIYNQESYRLAVDAVSRVGFSITIRL